MQNFEHGGNLHKAARETGMVFLDFSANINPLGPPEWLRSLISRELEGLRHYPDPEYLRLRQAIGRFHGVEVEQVVVGNGTSELLHFFMQIVNAERLVLPVPSYVDYRRTAELAGIPLLPFILEEKDGFRADCDALAALLRPGDLAILGRPNNPTGTLPAADAILELADACPAATLLLDEAFLDFCEEPQSLGCVRPNICSLNSMTKFYGVPGLRVGYGLFGARQAEALRAAIPPWSVNSLAQVFAEEALADLEYQKCSRLTSGRLRQELAGRLAQFPRLKVFPGTANYLFLKVTAGEGLADFCQQQGILVRRCGNYQGLVEPERFFRIAVRTQEENARLLEIFAHFFGEGRRRPQPKKRAKTLMFQGTCSDAGKSILTAGLCRILWQDGVAVAPFKAQNMSLNSFVTLQGDEMGRAQVVQAQAARLDPDCRMNPVLLKPNTDTGSQVIVMGRPVGNMEVLEYAAYKPKIWQTVCDSFDSLAAEFDAVLLEGAGSPGEINLKKEDIVNMRMAQYARAPVLLVGDIDRGGVYASFVGIMETLAAWERELVAGFLVNKFRGQAALLQPAHEYMLRHTGKPVLGVVPWLPKLGLPEEDSVSFKRGSFNRGVGEDGGVESVEIAVVNLPHISNFTDVEPFLDEPDVLLRVVDEAGQLGRPDAILLVGTKNVLHDLDVLHRGGFAEAIGYARQRGCEVVGICGGYQMLGRAIRDPYRIESALGEVAGLGFLEMVTVIEKSKNLVRKRGIHQPTGQQVHGYEIHHGLSSSEGPPLLRFEDGSHCGSAVDDGLVWGCYLHGIFDSDGFRRHYIDQLRIRKGLTPVGKVVAPYDLEAAFDRLAASLRENLDMDSIYRLLEL